MDDTKFSLYKVENVDSSFLPDLLIENAFYS